MRIKPKSVKGSILLIIVVVIIGVVTTYSTGIAHSRSAMRIGYIGNNGWDSWSGHYELLDGKMKRTLHYDSSKDITLDVKTESGTLSIEIQDKAGNVIFSQNNIGTVLQSISVSGNIVVTVSADKHKGSFAFN